MQENFQFTLCLNELPGTQRTFFISKQPKINIETYNIFITVNQLLTFLFEVICTTSNKRQIIIDFSTSNYFISAR